MSPGDWREFDHTVSQARMMPTFCESFAASRNLVSQARNRSGRPRLTGQSSKVETDMSVFVFDRWWVGPWQHCSTTCGSGVHRRTVICVRSLSPNEQIALEDYECENQPRPTSSEPCRHPEPCPEEQAWWITTLWHPVCSFCGLHFGLRHSLDEQDLWSDLHALKICWVVRSPHKPQFPQK